MLESEILVRIEWLWNDKFHGFHGQQCYVMLCNVVGAAVPLMIALIRSEWNSVMGDYTNCQPINLPSMLTNFVMIYFLLKRVRLLFILFN